MEEKSRKELIEDSEVKLSSDDKLDHILLAKQLASLSLTATPPSNIALYGPWGSGKSGIANLVAEEIKKHPRSKAKFARFDAFKYAENPLRRNFISAIAKEIKVKNTKFNKDLYANQVINDITIPVKNIAKISFIFFLALASITSIPFFFSLLSGEGFEEAIEKLLLTSQASIGQISISASLITALISIIGNNFKITKTYPRADSDEEFEALLVDLVEKSGTERLILFIDELDRCSSEEVVATLDAIRTFFGVPGCIFIVAADQQVLEHALTNSSEKSIPIDKTNPYYSSGSAYLDKVFQYQVSVPPLMPYSVTNFSAELVNGREGIWKEINSDLAISILVPWHTKSPRRIKILLNAFSLFCNLIKDKAVLNINISSDVSQIAQLVCLRIEFPIFARSLMVDNRLPQIVLDLSENGTATLEQDDFWEKYSGITDETKRLACEYAFGKTPTDVLLNEEKNTDEEKDKKISLSLKEQQSKQLLRYLKRTRSIPPIKKELIFLQSAGGNYGLPSSFSDQLESCASDASFSEAKNLISTLKPDEMPNAVKFLLELEKNTIGIERNNVIECILYLLNDISFTTKDSLEYFIISASPVIIENPKTINRKTLPGLWKLICSIDSFQSEELIRHVVASDTAYESIDSFKIIMTNSSSAINNDTGRLKEETVNFLMSYHHEKISEIILELKEDESALLFRHIKEEISEQLKSIMVNQKEDESEDKDSIDWRDIIESLLDLAVRFSKKSAAASGHLLFSILSINDKEIRNRAQRILPDIPKINNPTLANLILDQTRYRPLSAWNTWIDSIDFDKKPDLDYLKIAESLLSTILSRQNEPESNIRVSVRAVRRLVGDDTKSEDIPLPEESFATEEGTTFDSAKNKDTITKLKVFTNEEIVPTSYAIEIRLINLLQSINTEQEEGEEYAETIKNYILKSIEEIYLGWPEESGKINPEITENLDMIFDSLASSGWLDEYDTFKAIVTLQCAIDPDKRRNLTPLASEAVEKALHDYEIDPEDLSRWVHQYNGPVLNLLKIIDQPLIDAPSKRMREEIALWRARQDHQSDYDITRHFIAERNQSFLPKETLLAIGFFDISEDQYSSILREKFKYCEHNDDKRNLLRIWSQRKIQNERTRKNLIDEIIIPLLGENKECADHVLRHIASIAKPIPNGIKIKLKEEIVSSCSSNKLRRKKAASTLESLGYKIRKNLWGKAKLDE